MKLSVENLHSILDQATALAGMGIVIKEVSRDGDRAVYVAEIPKNGRVTPHYHPKIEGGTEWYQIIESGSDAVMFTGQPVFEKGNVVKVNWDQPTEINLNDFFIVPNGAVHCLVAGKARLRFVFGCPDAHLDNNQDKVVLDKFFPPGVE